MKMARTQRFMFNQRLKWWKTKDKSRGHLYWDKTELHSYYVAGRPVTPIGPPTISIYANTLSMWGGFTIEPARHR